jgi:hypothetical protein
MKYKKFDLTLRNTNAVNYFIHGDQKLPIGNINDKETFIYGEGYIKIPKKSKRFLAEPLPENYTPLDVLNSYINHGEQVTYKLIADDYNPSNCSYNGYNHEMRNIIKFGESYGEFLNLVNNIDNQCISILKEKYGCIFSSKFLIYNDNIISAYRINEITGKCMPTDWQQFLFLSNCDVSVVSFLAMDIHYNTVSHERSIKTLISTFNEKFNLVPETKQNEILSNINITEFSEYYTKLDYALENLSVKEMIEILYNTDVANMVEQLNDFKLTETEYYKSLVKKQLA